MNAVLLTFLPSFVSSLAVVELLSSKALKTLKGATDNVVAKTLGADKFAEGQIVKAVGMKRS